MTKRILILLLAAMLAVAVVPTFAQDNAGTVKGTAVDEKKQPIAGGTVVLQSADGKKITIKTDKGGTFEKTGVPAGSYKVQLLIDGQPRWGAEGFAVNGGQTAMLNIDMAAAAAQASMTAEQKKQMEEQQKKAEAERSKIKNLNAMLASAKKMETAGDVDGAIGIYQQAVQADPTKDLLWANLGSAYLLKAQKITDHAQLTEIANQAAEAMQKAVSMKPNDAGYHNNLGQAYAKAGKTDDAAKEYQQAAQLDPVNAAQYYFNLGAILTNTGKVDEAVVAFDKAIAADPNKADAYYWKGVNMLGKATIDPKTQKMNAPAGTEEAFNKYLALDPNGKFADPAKQMLASMGATVETSYKKTGKKK